MEIKVKVVGSLGTNCYLLCEGKDALIVDPGDQAEELIKWVEPYHLVGILLTHRHFDHVGALQAIQEKNDTPVFDYFNLKEGKVTIEPFHFMVIATPGHTEDSISFYFEKEQIFISGDFLFEGSIGRTDFPGGNDLQMQESLLKMNHYDGKMKIYPGHGNATTLENERNNNPFLERASI